MRLPLALLAAGATAAVAAPTLDSRIQFRSFHAPPGGSAPIFEERTITQGASTSVSELFTSNSVYPGHRFDAEASASAAFVNGSPVLRSFSQMELSNAPFSNPTQDYRTNAIAGFGDNLTVNAPGVATGSNVRIRLTFNVTGFTSNLLPGQGGGVVFAAPHTDARLGSSITAASNSNFNFQSTLPGTMVFTDTVRAGIPALFTLNLFASVTSDRFTAFNLWSDSFDHYATQGRSDFSSTAYLSNIVITDTSGNPIAGATLSGSDGQDWSPAQPAPVPMPEVTMTQIGTQLDFSWESDVAFTYTLRFSDDLESSSWQDVAAPKNGTGGAMSCQTTKPTVARRFWSLFVESIN